MKTGKKAIKKWVLATVIFIMFCFVCVFALTTQKVYAANGYEIDYEFESVPVESIDLYINGNIAEIQPRQSFTVSYEVNPWYTTTSHVYIDVVPQNAAAVTKISDIKFKDGKAQGSATISVSNDAVVGSTIKVIASADNIESSAAVLTVAKIPVTGLKLSLNGSDDKLHIGKARTVSCECYPAYASVQDVHYELSGNGLQYIESFDEKSGTIKAKNDINMLDVNSTVTITAYSDDNPNAFDSITLSLYMPTTVVEISAITPRGRVNENSDAIAVANSKSGDTVQLHTKINGVESSGLNYVIVSGQEYIENGMIQTGGMFTLRPTSTWTINMQKSHPKIKIRAAYSDGFDEITISVYVPVETISFVKAVPIEVENNRSYDLMAEAFPKFATLLAENVVPISYSLNGIESNVAKIDGSGVLSLPKSLTSKGSVINYAASLVNAWEDVDSVPLNHSLTVVPVYANAFKSITILKDGISVDTEGVKILPSDILNVEVEFTSDNATEINVDLLENSKMISTVGQTISVAQLSEMTENNPYISLDVCYDNGGHNFYKNIGISIYVPALSAKISDAMFLRDKPLNINSLVTINGHGFASNKNIEWGNPIVSNCDSNVEVSCFDGNLNISTNANAGTIVSVPFRTAECDEWQYKDFEVAPLLGSFTVGYTKTSSDEDSRQYDINVDAPQLEEGQNVELLIKFNGVSASENFGVTYSINVSDNATLNFMSKKSKDNNVDTFHLSANAGQSGQNNYINYTITVHDGSSTYYIYTSGSTVSSPSEIDVITNKIAIFKRISELSVFDMTAKVGECVTLTSWDSSVTYDRKELSWSITSGKMERNRIISAPDSGFILTISANQKYNNVEIAFSVEIPFYSIIYYNDTQLVKKIYVKRGCNITLEGNICAKKDHIQTGWFENEGGIKEYALNYYYTGTKDLKLYAKMTRIRNNFDISNDDHDIDDNNVYYYKEDINPEFDICELKKWGYTKIKLTIVFDCKENNDGYQDIRIFSGSDSNRIGDETVEHGAGYKETSWWSHTVNYNISLDNFAYNTASFYIGWGAHGCFGDTWVLGHRIITVVVE